MTTRYMLDTDTSSYIMKKTHPAALNKLRSVPPGEVCLSVITAAELRYGVAVSPRQNRDQEALTRFLRFVKVMDFCESSAEDYASIRAHLKTSGTMIGANDLWIAAHARSLKLVLVTNNTSEFGRVPDLRMENWTAE